MNNNISARKSSLSQFLAQRPKRLTRNSSLDADTFELVSKMPEVTEEYVKSLYDFGQLLGEGASGVVQVVTNKATG